MENQTLQLKGGLLAVTIVSNTWSQSYRFYKDALGYSVLEEGVLTVQQKAIFGVGLNRFCLFGHSEGSVVRLIETLDNQAIPNRIGANPWDNGLGVIEAGTPDVDAAYWQVIRNKFGAIAPPTTFDCEGPEPLGYVLMKSTAFIGPSGEQIFVTQIVDRKGGVSLLKEQSVKGINTPANAVISLENREQQFFYDKILGIVPVNDLVLKQPGAAAIMAGPSDMGFDMCLMGAGQHRIGMEQHVYEGHNPTYTYRTYPSSFQQTGLACASWQGKDFEELKAILLENNIEIISEIGLPIRDFQTPKALVFRGIVGEILEIIFD